MNQSARSRAAWLLLAGLLWLTLGCMPRSQASIRSANAVTARPSPTPAPARVLTWSVWGSSWELDTDRRVARLFESEHPGVHVEITHREWEEYFDWLKSEWDAGRSPDVMFLNYVPMRAAEGMLIDLDPYVARDAYDVADFYPALLEQFRYDGHYYGLPRDNDTKVIYYNKDAFLQAGLPFPRDDWTWADLRRSAITLTNAPRQYGFGFEKDHWWRLWVWQNGGSLVDHPYVPTRVLVNEPESVAAVDFLAGLVTRDKVTPPVDLLNSNGLTRLFQDGRLAMAFGGHAKVPSFVENPDLHWDIVALPKGRQSANVAGGAGYAVSRLAPDRDLAWEFVKFLVSPKGEAIFAESGVITPARRSVREDNIFLRKQPFTARVFYEQTAQGRPNLIFAGADGMSAALDRALDPVWRGQQSAETALNAVAPSLERFLPH